MKVKKRCVILMAVLLVAFATGGPLERRRIGLLNCAFHLALQGGRGLPWVGP
ncbi:MAG: hypothetical protein PWR28_1416 [Synergistaceae bacterium]|nr:hypothetical protein [Synergistaceae bacterium]